MMESNQHSENLNIKRLSDQVLGINPSLKIIFCGENQILVIHGVRSEFKQIIRDEGKTRLLSRILRHLVASPSSLDELVGSGLIEQNQIQETESLIDALLERGILTNRNESPTASYVNSILGHKSPLSMISIGIVGAGPLGIQIAGEFARIGVGSLRIIDDRHIGAGEFEQAHFVPKSRHMETDLSYVEFLKAHLQDIGYDSVKISTSSYCDAGVLEELFAKTNFVVATAEVFASHLFHTVDMMAISSDKPWISVFMDGSEGCIGPIYVPSETCCYNEFEIQMEAALATPAGEYYTYKEAMSKAAVEGTQYVFPPYLSVAAGFVASVVSSFLLSGRSYLVGRCLRINFEKPYVDYEEILKLPRSPTSISSRNSYRHTYL